MFTQAPPQKKKKTHKKHGNENRQRWGKEDVRALSLPITFSFPNEPQQLHVAPGADFSTAVVQWATADATKPRVRWSLSPLLSSRTRGEKSGKAQGTNATVPVFEVEGQTSTYTRGQMCGGSANSSGWFEPGNLHRATLTGLPAASRVFYEVFDGDDEERATAVEKANGAKNNDAKAIRRFGSFFTPAAPPREGEKEREEARIVLMADAGVLLAFFFSFLFLRGESGRRRKKTHSFLFPSRPKKKQKQEPETPPLRRSLQAGSSPSRGTPRPRSQRTSRLPRPKQRGAARRRRTETGPRGGSAAAC